MHHLLRLLQPDYSAIVLTCPVMSSGGTVFSRASTNGWWSGAESESVTPNRKRDAREMAAAMDHSDIRGLATAFHLFLAGLPRSRDWDRMWLGVRNDATHDMGDRPLPPTYKSAWPHTVGHDMMSRATMQTKVLVHGVTRIATAQSVLFRQPTIRPQGRIERFRKTPWQQQ